MNLSSCRSFFHFFFVKILSTGMINNYVLKNVVCEKLALGNDVR